MTEYVGWALILGLVIGGALVWFAIGRLPRSGDEIPESERHNEAEWISRTINNSGGMAPSDLVEEILDLHGAFLERRTDKTS